MVALIVVNRAKNLAFARICNKYFIRYANHRVQLSTKDMLDKHSETIETVRILLKKIEESKNSCRFNGNQNFNSESEQ